jgi:drug/metabolite transporter (DMT)-like permease
VAREVGKDVTRLGSAVVRALRASADTRPNNGRAILAMLLATMAFVTGDAMMKLMSARLPTGETMFIRGVIGSMLVFGLVWAVGEMATLRASVTRLATYRVAGDVGAAVCFQNALSRLPFADVSALVQVNPLVATAAAALFLGETVRWRRWLATIVGLFGAILIIKPGGSAFQWASLLAIGAVFASVARDLVTRRMPAGTPAFTTIAFSMWAVTLASLGFLPFERWSWPSAGHVAILGFTACCMLAGQLGIFIAVRLGEISVLAPYRYTSLVWALMFSLLLFREFPDRWTLVGMAIIVVAGLYTFYREQTLRREAAIRAAVAPPDTRPPQGPAA